MTAHPTPAPGPTEAHKELARKVRLRESSAQGAELIAASERAAVEKATDDQHTKSYSLGYKDGWRDGRLPLNDPPQEVVLADGLAIANAERDQLRAEVEVANAQRSKDIAENARLGAEVERYNQQLADKAIYASSLEQERAQLLADKARLDALWSETTVELLAANEKVRVLREALELMIDLWVRHCSPRNVEFDSQIKEARDALAATASEQPKTEAK